MLIKAKSLIKKTAKDLNLSEEQVTDVVNFYYEELRAKMEGLEGLVCIRKLYLEKNKISRLEGLTNCRVLEELYLS